MKTITAVIPAKNEEKNIERCIKSVLWCDNVLVISTGTDKTAEIAKKLGAEVVIKGKSNIDDFEELQKNLNWAGENLSTDWILRVDADEVVTPELADEIHKNVLTLKRENVSTLQLSNIVAYGIPRIPNYLGTFLKGGDWSYDRLVRLYRPGKCRYRPIVKVHEQFYVEGEIGYLKNSLLHYSHPDRKTLLKKFDIYTTLEAHQLNDSKISALLKLIFFPPYIFLRWMVYHKGYLDGFIGVDAAIMRSYYDIMLYKKLLLLKNK